MNTCNLCANLIGALPYYPNGYKRVGTFRHTHQINRVYRSKNIPSGRTKSSYFEMKFLVLFGVACVLATICEGSLLPDGLLGNKKCDSPPKHDDCKEEPPKHDDCHEEPPCCDDDPLWHLLDGKLRQINTEERSNIFRLYSNIFHFFYTAQLSRKFWSLSSRLWQRMVSLVS